MPATVTCPNCNVTLKPKTPVPAGTRIKCPKCQTIFVIPDDGTAPAEAAPKPGPKSGVARPAAPKPKPAPPPEEEEEEIAEAADGADDAEEEGEAPAKPKKKIPLWVWLASGGAALVLLCGCCGVPSVLYLSGGLANFGMGTLAGGGNVSMTTYHKLKKGMTEDEVKKVMGGAPSLQSDLAGGIHIETWKGSGDDFITVGFQKDKSISGVYEFTNGPAKQSGGGILP